MSDEQASIRFVQMVEKHPCLYNTTLPEYSRRDVTEKAWHAIAHHLKFASVAGCKEKWKNLRSVYVRKRNRQKREDGRHVKPYYLNGYMHFLAPFTKPTGDENDPGIPSVCHLEADLETNADDKTASDINNTPPSKPPSDNTNKHFENTSRKYFLLSLLPEVEELTEPQFRLLKRRMLALIDEINEYPAAVANSHIYTFVSDPTPHSSVEFTTTTSPHHSD